MPAGHAKRTILTRMFTAFAYALAGGMQIILVVAPISKMAWRFLRLVCQLAFAAATVVLVWSFREAGWGLEPLSDWPVRLGVMCDLATATTSVVARWSARQATVFRGLCLLGGSSGIAAACILGLQSAVERGAAPLLIVAGQILGSLLMGSITVSWLLGHAYLTATKMTIAPLRHMSRTLMVCAGMRVLFLPCSVLAVWWSGNLVGSEILRLAGNHWLILSIRVAVGLVAVSVFAYMVNDCVKRRSTQSATGILYFGSVFAYIGELASLDLLRETGWPT